ncbi:MAG: hypothetical protein WD534_04145 [Phycisphaeraceae bacterium]
MKRKHVWGCLASLTLLVVVVLGVCFIGFVWLIVSINTPSPSQEVFSPDSQRVAITSVNQDRSDPTRFLCVIVEVKDASGELLHREITPASDRMRWSIHWQDNHELVLDSSDVGRFVIAEQPNGTWEGDFEQTEEQPVTPQDSDSTDVDLLD